MKKTLLIPFTLLLLTACKPPKVEDTRVTNQIKTITITVDSSMVNPTMRQTPETLVVNSDLTLLLSSGKTLNMTKAQFNKLIEDIKFVDLSTLKEIKHPPALGGSYKSISITTEKNDYGFRSNNGTDYPPLIAQLNHKIYQLIGKLTAPSNSTDEWKKLKQLKEYTTTDFNLKEGVEYLEIRTYYRGQKEKKYRIEDYSIAIRMGQTPLSFFKPKLVEEFKKIAPNLSKETNLKHVAFCLMSGCTSNISNGFMIDSHNKMWVMNTTEDILNMIGDVDTPAEAKLVLWLNDRRMGEPKEDIYQYRKSSNGYKILYEYDNSLSNDGDCGHFIYEMFITKNGKITQKKLLKKSDSKNGCLAMD